MIKTINDRFTIGYIHTKELGEAAPTFGMSEKLSKQCYRSSEEFRPGIYFDEKCTFAKMKFFDPTNDLPDDCLAVYITRGKILIIDIYDSDRSNSDRANAVLGRLNPETITVGKFIYTFIEELVAHDAVFLESLTDDISDMEQSILNDEIPTDFNKRMLEIKRKLHKLHVQYERHLDFLEVLESDENNLLPDDEASSVLISNIEKRVARFRDNVDYMSETVDHLQDAYSSHLDIKMNHNMMILTGLTTIFFPLTIIVGWYGMNFKYMPEFGWPFGYIYVIALSIVAVFLLIWIARKNKWL